MLALEVQIHLLAFPIFLALYDNTMKFIKKKYRYDINR